MRTAPSWARHTCCCMTLLCSPPSCECRSCIMIMQCAQGITVAKRRDLGLHVLPRNHCYYQMGGYGSRCAKLLRLSYSGDWATPSPTPPRSEPGPLWTPLVEEGLFPVRSWELRCQLPGAHPLPSLLPAAAPSHPAADPRWWEEVGGRLPSVQCGMGGVNCGRGEGPGPRQSPLLDGELGHGASGPGPDTFEVPPGHGPVSTSMKRAWSYVSGCMHVIARISSSLRTEVLHGAAKQSKSGRGGAISFHPDSGCEA